MDDEKTGFVGLGGIGRGRVGFEARPNVPNHGLDHQIIQHDAQHIVGSQ